jgi:hypothetical protein
LAARDRTSPDDVFINCPFDSEYEPTFRALVFAIYACGFRPRSALELEDAAQTRIEKLFNIIDACRYGIHDISRTDFDDANGLPRFNMPLELGIFLGAKHFGPGHKAKRALILDIERYRFRKFISDLAGMDIQDHGGDPRRAIEKTRNWLTNVSRRILPSAAKINRLYEKFLTHLASMADKLEFLPDNIPYADFDNLVVGWLREAEPEPEPDAQQGQKQEKLS